MKEVSSSLELKM